MASALVAMNMKGLMRPKKAPPAPSTARPVSGLPPSALIAREENCAAHMQGWHQLRMLSACLPLLALLCMQQLASHDGAAQGCINMLHGFILSVSG